jgi:hypothetical protein
MASRVGQRGKLLSLQAYPEKKASPLLSEVSDGIGLG